MANTVLTPTMILRESMRLLRNELSLGKGFNKDYSKEFAGNGAGGLKIGDVVNARIPAALKASEDVTLPSNLSAQPYVETKQPVKLTSQIHVDVSFTMAELKLAMQDFSKRVLEPSIAALANKIDTKCANLTDQVVSHFVGKPGVTQTLDVATQIPFWKRPGAFLAQEACDMKGIRAVLDPFAEIAPLTGFAALFHKDSAISSQYSSGKMGAALGYEWDTDQNIVQHTVGATTGTVTGPTFATDTTAAVWDVRGSESGTAYITNPWLTDATGLLGSAAASSGASVTITPTFTGGGTFGFKAGDVVTVANIFAVNPQSRASTGKLRRFVVLADTALAATTVGITTVLLPVPVCTTGITGATADPLANCYRKATSATAVVTLGSPSTDTNEGWTVGNIGASNVIFHPSAFTLVSAPLEMPEDVSFKAQEVDPQLGIMMRILRQYTISDDSQPCRIDVLIGTRATRPQLAVKAFQAVN